MRQVRSETAKVVWPTRRETVMTGVNIVLAVMHQGVGALVVASTIWGLHVIGRRRTA